MNHRLSCHDCNLDDFRQIVEQPDDISYTYASHFDHAIPVYNAVPNINDNICSAFKNELTDALLNGPGIVVLKNAVDADIIERASKTFWNIIDQQHRQGGPAGDHYGKPGANDRIWNALEKLAVADPETFVDYHTSDAIALAAQAWLGPRYQLTEQVNVVNPQGVAQHPHRDYHIGFLTDNEAEQFPRHAHPMSSMLTLQGAIAHCDMPVETGPTMYLPHSHKYELGYLAWRRPEFVNYFQQNHVQLELKTGDAVFFSPAIFHAAGTNTTSDVRRMANLLQISSAFGRATEAVDRTRIVKAIYLTLLERMMNGGADSGGEAGRELFNVNVENVIAAAAEGYAFPTDLDQDQPTDGLAPPSQADLVQRALTERWTLDKLTQELDQQNTRRRL